MAYLNQTLPPPHTCRWRTWTGSCPYLTPVHGLPGPDPASTSHLWMAYLNRILPLPHIVNGLLEPDPASTSHLWMAYLDWILPPLHNRESPIVDRILHRLPFAVQCACSGLRRCHRWEYPWCKMRGFQQQPRLCRKSTAIYEN